jgi:copper(I)-binding protein
VTRWNRCLLQRRLLLGAIAVLVPVLAGCEAGADAPTVDFHQASAGVSETVNGVTIDDAFVLGPSLTTTLPVGGQAGVFLSIETKNNDQLTSVTAPGAASSVQLVGGPVTLTANSMANLSGPQPQIVLTGLTSALSGGKTVNLSLYFANAGEITVTVPVEPAAYDFTTYAPPPSPTPSASPTTSPMPISTASGSPSASASASASPSGG